MTWCGDTDNKLQAFLYMAVKEKKNKFTML